MRKKLEQFILAGVISVAVFFGAAAVVSPVSVHAAGGLQDTLKNGTQGIYSNERTAGNNNAPTPDPINVIWNLIQVVLGLLGMMMILIFLYAGFLYFNARGVAAEVTKAQDMIKQAVIGMIIIASAWGIGYFVINAIAGAVTTRAESVLSSMVSPAYAATTDGHIADVGSALQGGAFGQFIDKSGAAKDPNFIVTVVQNIINILLGFLGVGMVLLFLYAGFLYLTAGGDAANTKKAVAIIQQAVIGTLIILASWGLSWFVINTIVTRILTIAISSLS